MAGKERATMARWLSSQDRGRDSQDIRKFVRVHGKIIPSQADSTDQEDRDCDDFSTPITRPNSEARPTKQLTLLHFNKKPSESKSSKDKAHEQEIRQGESKAQRLFLPASKFSTGVRRKARRDDANKENMVTQESEHKLTTEETPSPLKKVQHRSPDKRRKRERHHPLTPRQTSPQKGPGRRKKSELIIESQDGFLSSRKKTDKHRGQFTLEASYERTVDSDMQTGSPENGDLNCLQQPRSEMEKVEENVTHSIADNDSDVYINTDQLLEELSNCEKLLLNAHT